MNIYFFVTYIVHENLKQDDISVTISAMISSKVSNSLIGKSIKLKSER